MRIRALMLGALAAASLCSPASAALLLTETFGVNHGPSVTASATTFTGVEAQTSAQLGAPLFQSATLGVLTGASFSASATIKAQGHVSGSNFPSFIGSETGDGFGGASLSGAGFAPIDLGSPYTFDLRTLVTCVGGFGVDCHANSPLATATLSGSRTIDSSALAAYLAGPSAQALTATVKANAGVDGSAAHGAFDNTVTLLSETATFEFDYLHHASASFGAGGLQPLLTLNLGQIIQGSSAASHAFNIFNFATDAPNTTGLDLDAVTGTGDTSALTTNLAQFANLAAGGGMGFTAFLDSSTVGDFSASYRIALSDADIGVGQTNHGLLIRLSGRVVAASPPPPTGVPEPATWAMMTGGFGLVGAAARRGRRAAGSLLP